MDEAEKLKILYLILFENGYNFDNPPLSNEELMSKVIRDLRGKHKRQLRKDKLNQINNNR